MDLKKLKDVHYDALLAHGSFTDLSKLGKCGKIIHAACLDYESAKKDQAVLDLSTSVPNENAGLLYVPVKVLTPIWVNWASPDGDYVGSSFHGYTAATMLMATVVTTSVGDDGLRWSVAAREVLGLFECRKGPAFFHLGTARCRGQEYGLDLVMSPTESLERMKDEEDEVCNVRLVLKKLGPSTSEVVVIDFKGCYAAPVHHNFEQHVFVSGLLAWPKKELISTLSTCIEKEEAFTVEAKMGLF